MFSSFNLRLFLVMGIAVFPLSEVRAALYSLTTVTNGSGTISRNPTNSLYPAGAVVTITANPGAGWYFAGWTGDEISTANPLNVLMESNKVVVANFQNVPTYSLTISTNGVGSVSLNPAGGSYASNTVVTASALPAVGWVFVNWSGDASGSANPLAITMNSNKTVGATFAQPPTVDQPPQNVTGSLGETVVFNVHALGSGLLSYEWSFNGLDLSGATDASLVLTNVQLSNEGAYSVIVTNLYGAITNSATLSIINSCVGTNTVTQPTDAALRKAVAIGGVVRFCFNGTITLTNTINVTRKVILDAQDRSVTISGNNSVRLFNVNSGVTFSATNLVLINGYDAGATGLPGEGGAILVNGGTAQLTLCTLASNSVAGGQGTSGGFGGEGRGGAVCLRGGSLLLDRVNLVSNTATGGQGAIFGPQTDTGGNALGGALYVTNGTVTLANSIVNNNLTMAPGGSSTVSGGPPAAAYGGAIYQHSSDVSISNCTISANTAHGGNAVDSYAAPAYGGGLAVISGHAMISQSRIILNTVSGGNGFPNWGGGEAAGGGVFSGGTVSALDTDFSKNNVTAGLASAARGGGIYDFGTTTLNRCSLTLNNTTAGGGRFSPGNGLGGGVCNYGHISLTNCTFALNTAIGGGGQWGAAPGVGLGGGLYNNGGSAEAMNITVASNSVAEGYDPGFPGLIAGANVANTNGTVALGNSLLAYSGTNFNAWGPITDLGFNMCSDGSAGFNSGSSFNYTDPQLEPLGDYGGFTSTMALQPNSPAVDFGTSAGAPSTDQRGVVRPSGAGVDIGAYELQQTSAPMLQIGWAGASLQLSFAAQPNLIYNLLSSSTFTNWGVVESIGPFTVETNVIRTIQPAPQPNALLRLRVQ